MTNVKLVASLAVFIMISAGVAAIMYSDDSDAASSEPIITDAGFVEDKTGLFYYSKFGTAGFTYSDSVSKGVVTHNSVSGDTPTKNIGTTMQANSLFVSISKLDINTEYKLNISEYSVENVFNYGISVKLNENIVKTFVYMSVNDGIPYCDGVALAYTSLEGATKDAFNTNASEVHYTFSVVADNTTVCEYTLNDPINYSAICGAIIKTVGEEDGVATIGKNYGYVSSGDSQYAGAVLAGPEVGDFVCIFYMSNVSNDNLELIISDGSDHYTVKNSELFYGKNVTTGYGYAIVSLNTLSENGFDDDLESVNVSIGANGNVYATFENNEKSNNDDSDDDTIIAIAVGAIVAIIVIAGILYFRRAQ